MKYKSYEVNPKSLKDLFDSKEFQIPPYQRDYSWIKTQYEGFEESLMQLTKLDDGREEISLTMFLSQFVFASSPDFTRHIHELRNQSPISTERGRLKDVEGLQVVDGQQRLTTLTLVIHLMLSKIDPDYHKKNKMITNQQPTSDPIENLKRGLPKINRWFLKEENIIDAWCENKPLYQKTRLYSELHETVWKIIFDSNLSHKQKKSRWSSILKEFNQNGHFQDEEGNRKKVKDGDRKLFNAYLHFYQFVDNFQTSPYKDTGDRGTKTTEFKNLYDNLLSNANTDETAAHSTVLKAHKIEDGVFIFNALNTKNKQLSPADLIKMHAYELCMKQSNIGQLKYEKSEKFMDDFTELESYEVFKTEANLINYLRVYLVSKHGRKVRNIHTNKMITLSRDTLYKGYSSTITTIDLMQQTLRDLRKLLPIYQLIKNVNTRAINGSKDAEKKARKILNKMSVLLPNMNAFDHIFILTFDSFKDSVGGDYSYKNNIVVLANIIELIYKFSVRFYTVCERRGNVVMTALDNIHESLKNSINDIDEYYEILKECLTKIQPPKKEFIDKFKEFYEKDNKKSKVMLWDLQDKIATEDGYQQSDFDCEHIFPKEGHDKWVTDYAEKGYPDATIIKLKEKRYHIGNLTLLKDSDNRELGDAIIDDKLPYYTQGKGGYTLGIYKLFKEAYTENNEVWDDQAIAKLQNKYGENLEQVYKI